MRERRSWQLRLDGRGRWGGGRFKLRRALPAPVPQRGPHLAGCRPLVGPGGMGSVPTDGEREFWANFWPSLVQGE